MAASMPASAVCFSWVMIGSSLCMALMRSGVRNLISTMPSGSRTPPRAPGSAYISTCIHQPFHLGNYSRMITYKSHVLYQAEIWRQPVGGGCITCLGFQGGPEGQVSRECLSAQMCLGVLIAQRWIVIGQVAQSLHGSKQCAKAESTEMGRCGIARVSYWAIQGQLATWPQKHFESPQYSTHLLRVDLAIYDNPCTSSKLGPWRQVHHHRLFVGAQVLDYD